MGVYTTGQSGALHFDGKWIGKVADWSLQASVDALEVTSLSDTARQFTPGIKNASGSCSLWMYRENGSSAVAGEQMLNKVLRLDGADENDIYRMRLVYQSNKGFEFDCILTDAALSLSVGEVVQAKVSFQVTSDMAGVYL